MPRRKRSSKGAATRARNAGKNKLNFNGFDVAEIGSGDKEEDKVESASNQLVKVDILGNNDSSSEKSLKRFGKYRCLQQGHNSSQEENSEAESFTTHQLLPQEIQQIVLGEVGALGISADEYVVNTDDPCLLDDVVYEEVIEETVECDDDPQLEVEVVSCEQDDASMEIPFSEEVTYEEVPLNDESKSGSDIFLSELLESEIQGDSSEKNGNIKAPFFEEDLAEAKSTPSVDSTKDSVLPVENNKYASRSNKKEATSLSGITQSRNFQSSTVVAVMTGQSDPVIPAKTLDTNSCESAKEISPKINCDSDLCVKVENFDLGRASGISSTVIGENTECDQENCIKLIKEELEEEMEDAKLGNGNNNTLKPCYIKVFKLDDDGETNSNDNSMLADNTVPVLVPKQEIESDSERGVVSTETSSVHSCSAVFETDKPVKVKSRWRRSSELEMGSGGQAIPEQTAMNKQSPLDSPVMNDVSVQQPIVIPGLDQAMELRLKSFETIPANEYHTIRSKSKEAKRMVCDCSLSKEELARNEKGCGDDCLNRLLMIECGSRCGLGNLCSNKRFQNCEYTKCEVIKTEKKGLGLKSNENVTSGHFLMEYVGEVIDPKEFRRRAKDYAKDKNIHYYFMALKSDTIIDATQKGNISRFINHSCEPNAETQKWTVNGELRIGFFSKRPIAAGEEITFDYQLQRYGKEAQRCFCDSSKCRGWIGEDPEKEKERDRNRKEQRREKKRREEKRKDFRDSLNDMDLEEEVEKLCTSGLKNQAHTLTLCRLMVRIEDYSYRSQLLTILQEGDTRCLRLFLDYHGLALVWSWMMDNVCPSKLKMQILNTLFVLPIQNKTMLKDSKVLSVVEKWAKYRGESMAIGNRKERSSTEDENSTSPNGDSQCAMDAKVVPTEDIKSGDETVEGGSELSLQNDNNEKEIVEKSKHLLEKWSDLKEEFRIPKKQRIEQMKEHEREADLAYNDPRENQSYDSRHRNYEKDSGRYREKDKKRRDSPEIDRATKKRIENRILTPVPRIPKAQRRQLFAMKVEEEERQKKQMEEMWQKHQEQCMALGVDPTQTAMMNPQTGYPNYYHPSSGQWLPFPPCQDGGVMCDMEGKPLNLTPPMFSPNQPPPNLPPNMFPPGNPFGPPNSQPSFMNPSQAMQFPPFVEPPHNSPMYPQQGYVDPSHPPYPPPGYHPPMPNNSYPPLANAYNNYQPPPQVGVMAGQPPGMLHPQAGLLPPQSPGVMPPQPVGIPPQSPQLLYSPAAPQPFQPPPPQQTPAFPQDPQIPIAPPLPLYPPPPPAKLPPKWKSTKDKEGRTYYYHTKTRKSQWLFPAFDPNDVSESSSDSSDSSDMDDSSSDEEDEKVQEDEEEEEQDDEMMSEVAAEMEAAEPTKPLPQKEKEEPVQESQEPVLKKRREGLVQVAIISPRDDEYYRKGVSKSKIRDAKEKILKQKMKLKARARKRHASSTSAKCEADTSSGPKRRIKDMFRIHMAHVVVACLNAYRKPDCKIGRITSTDDFKHLARKLTHFVMLKELRHCHNVEDLECNDNVKHKARDFIKKYMSKFGTIYKRDAED